MTSDERKLLKQYTKSFQYRELIAPYLFGGFLVFGVLIFAVRYGGDFVLPLFGLPGPSQYRVETIVGCATVAVLLMGMPLLREIRALRAAGAGTDPAAEDLRRGITSVETLGVLASVEIEEFYDEGAGFFLELDDGRVLCVIGQQLYPYALTSEQDPESPAEEQTPPFPSDKIAFSYAPISKVFLDFEGVGVYLKPRSKVRYDAKGPDKSDLVDNTFYQGSMEEVLARFSFSEEPLEAPGSV